MSSIKPPKKKKIAKLQEKALTFVVRRQGRLSARAAQTFCDKASGKSVSKEFVNRVLQDARETFCEHDAHLFVCSDSSCKKRKIPKDIASEIKKHHKKKRLAVTKTNCLGPCSKAPVAVLRVGLKSRFFTELKKKKSAEEFLTLLNRIKTAPTNGNQSVCESVTQATVAPQPEAPSASTPMQPLAPELEPLAGLIGRWKGATEPGAGLLMQQTFLAEAKVNGQVVVLTIDEQLGVGENPPRQSSVVNIAWNPSVVQLEARVYSDHGTTFQGPVLIEGNRIIVPDHRPLPVENEAVSAQRIFVVSDQGIHETLEINRGKGHYEPFVSLLLTPAS